MRIQLWAALAFFMFSFAVLGQEADKKKVIQSIQNRSEQYGQIAQKIRDLYRDWETDRKSTRLNSSHLKLSRMPSSA